MILLQCSVYVDYGLKPSAFVLLAIVLGAEGADMNKVEIVYAVVSSWSRSSWERGGKEGYRQWTG